MIRYYAGEYRDVAELFQAAIHETASAFYSLQQIAAWAPAPVNYSRWQARCELKRPFLFVKESRIAGFLELDTDGHIDCHYVHPHYNRQGVGSALLQHAIQTALDYGLPRLYVEASHVAKGLYLKHGFRVVSENRVILRGVSLDNWIMERVLRPGAS